MGEWWPAGLHHDAPEAIKIIAPGQDRSDVGCSILTRGNDLDGVFDPRRDGDPLAGLVKYPPGPARSGNRTDRVRKMQGNGLIMSGARKDHNVSLQEVPMGPFRMILTACRHDCMTLILHDCSTRSHDVTASGGQSCSCPLVNLEHSMFSMTARLHAVVAAWC